MKFIHRNAFGVFFKIVCVVGVSFMVSYWFYKFEIEDRDVGVVDYVSLEEADDVEFPGVAICFKNPFLNERLKEIDPKITSTTYLQYLKGDIFEERFRHIHYDNVTLNLEDYFLYSEVRLSNETRSSSNHNTPLKHEIIFNGFYHGCLNWRKTCRMVK